MTELRVDDIHQAFFGWSHDGGKLDVLAYSFSRDNDARLWLSRLEGHIRLQPVPGTGLPAKALSYIEFDDGLVAIVRRVNLGYSSGRNNSHALIGPAQILDVSVALGLGDWTGWHDKPPPQKFMQRIPAALFDNVAADAATWLRPRAERRERELTMVLSKLLDDPGASLSVIGCADEDRLAMVWGLREASDEHLRRRYGTSRRWSFSTYEDRHDLAVKRLPEVVFLPARPDGAGVVDRTIVELDREPPSSVNSETAVLLVAKILGGPDFPPKEPVRRPVSVPAGASLPETVLSGQSRSAPAASNHDGAGRRHAEATVDGPGVQDHQEMRSESQPAAVLLEAKSILQFQAELNRLSAQGNLGRRRLRAALDIAAMNTATRFVEIDTRQDLLRRLLEVTYGPGLVDLRDPDALEHAVKLVESSQSEQLAMMLGRAAANVDQQKVSGAAFQRWSAGAYPAPNGKIDQILRSALRSRRLPMVASIATVAVLALVFLLGFLTGLPDEAQPAAAPGDRTTPSAQAPADSAGPVPGTAVVPVDENWEVFAFRQLADGTYLPVAPCRQVAIRTWQCDKPAPAPDASEPITVAISVPQDQLDSLQEIAGKGGAIKPMNYWGKPVPLS